MKKLGILLTFVCCIYANGQTTEVEGNVQSKDSLRIMDLQIINLETGEITLSDEDGNFKIKGDSGDRLYINSANFENKTIVLNPDALEEDQLIYLAKKTVRLRADLISEASIFFEAEDIYYPGEFVTAQSLGLPNQNKKSLQRSKSDEIQYYDVLKKQKIRLTSILTPNIATIYKYFSGELRSDLSLRKAEQRDLLINLMREDFGDSFFTNVIDLEIVEIDGFLNYCGKEYIIEKYSKMKTFELTEYFISQKDPYNLVKNGELPSDLKR